MELLAKGPVAAAEMFSNIISNFFIALGSKPEGEIKKSVLLPNKELGIFGKTLSYAGFIEEQGRGSLHMHCVIWLSDLSPKVLQAVGGIKSLSIAVASLIENIILGEISIDTHVKSLLYLI